MAGYFVVTAEQDTGTTSVTVTVTGYDGYKGSVALSYSSDSNPPPIAISPTSDNVFVPQNGSASTATDVELVAGQTVTLDIYASDGTLTDSTTCTVSSP